MDCARRRKREAARKVTPREKARDKREKKRDNGEKDGGIRLVPGEEASIEAERNIFRLATISLYPGTGCSTPHRENVVTPWRSIDLVVSSLAPTFAVLFVLFMISLAWGTNVSRSDQMVINLGNVILS